MFYKNSQHLKMQIKGNKCIFPNFIANLGRKIPAVAEPEFNLSPY